MNFRSFVDNMGDLYRTGFYVLAGGSMVLVVMGGLLSCKEAKKNFVDTSNLVNVDRKISSREGEHFEIQNNVQNFIKSIKPIAEGNTKFDSYLRNSLFEKKKNLFVSPISISVAFGMASAGAAGHTLDEIQKTFYFSKKNIHHKFKNFLEALDRINSDKLVLKIANRFWGNKYYPFSESFIGITDQFYGAPLVSVDFLNDTEIIRNEINGWTEGVTDKKIKDLVSKSSLSPESELVLVNAIYIKAAWKTPFKVAQTSKDSFYTTATEKHPVEMMNQIAYFRYEESDQVQIIEKDYFGDTLSMRIVLPKKRFNLSRILKKSDETPLVFTSTAKNRETKKIHLQLPKFEISETYELASILSKLGLYSVFNSKKADFSRMKDSAKFAPRLSISNVIHKTFIKVDEVGTEAAAATALVMLGSTAIDRSKVISFRADHPFLFSIIDKKTGTPLFTGVFMKPERL